MLHEQERDEDQATNRQNIEQLDQAIEVVLTMLRRSTNNPNFTKNNVGKTISQNRVKTRLANPANDASPVKALTLAN